jgi:hypothetical protein
VPTWRSGLIKSDGSLLPFFERPAAAVLASMAIGVGVGEGAAGDVRRNVRRIDVGLVGLINASAAAPRWLVTFRQPAYKLRSGNFQN